MNVISIWNPFPMLLVKGFKLNETRGWPAPKKLIGKRIGIASTKIVKPEQRAIFSDPKFRHFYDQTGLPQRLEDLPHGFLLGTVVLHSCDVITEECLEDITEEEKLYGFYEVGRYAWRMRDPVALEEPVPVRGAQGVWELKEHDLLRSKIKLVD